MARAVEPTDTIMRGRRRCASDLQFGRKTATGRPVPTDVRVFNIMER